MRPCTGWACMLRAAPWTVFSCIWQQMQMRATQLHARCSATPRHKHCTHLPSCGKPLEMDLTMMHTVSTHTIELPQAPVTSNWRMEGSMDSGKTMPSAAAGHCRGAG